MPNVEVYHRPTCPFCHAALKLLKRKNVTVHEINITQKPQKRPEMIQRANGRTTVPQIFIDGKHIGGFDDLDALESQGKLDALLS